jgi:hypothetical protein
MKSSRDSFIKDLIVEICAISEYGLKCFNLISVSTSRLVMQRNACKDQYRGVESDGEMIYLPVYGTRTG